MRYWCLGNEMDGPWQIGQLQAREYGRKARDVAKQMRVIDRGVQLIACGSSGTGMPSIWSGTAKSWRSASTRSTASRCTPTTATRGR